MPENHSAAPVIYDGPGLGIWRWTFSFQESILGCIYQNERGDFWFVAPNWCGPGQLCRVIGEASESPPVRLWVNQEKWDGEWEQMTDRLEWEAETDG